MGRTEKAAATPSALAPWTARVAQGASLCIVAGAVAAGLIRRDQAGVVLAGLGIGIGLLALLTASFVAWWHRG